MTTLVAFTRGEQEVYLLARSAPPHRGVLYRRAERIGLVRRFVVKSIVQI
jgi:hypothetical protein